MLWDTNVISELAKSSPNPGVLDLIQNVPLITISVITVEEIIYGLTARPKPKIEAWFQSFFRENCTVLPITTQIAVRAGQLRGELRRKGKTKTQADILIAATAELHQLTLVTRNIKDFEDCPIELFNPFLQQ